MQELFSLYDAVGAPVAVSDGCGIVYANPAAKGCAQLEKLVNECENRQKLSLSGVEYTVYTLGASDVQPAAVPAAAGLSGTLDCIRAALGAEHAAVYYLDGTWRRKAVADRLAPTKKTARPAELRLCDSAVDGECTVCALDGRTVCISRHGRACVICVLGAERMLEDGELAYLASVASLAESKMARRCFDRRLVKQSGAVLENPSVAAVWLDGDLNIIEVKGKGLSNVLYNSDEFIGHSLYEFGIDERITELAGTALEGRSGSITVELGGEWFDIYASRDDSAGVPLVCALIVDISKKVHEKESYDSAYGSLDVVALSMRVGFWTVDYATGEVTCDEGCCNIWDVPYYPDTASRELMERIGGADLDKLKEIIMSMALDPSNTFIKFDFAPAQIRSKQRYIELRAKLVWENGELTRIVGMMQDVTETRKMELAVQFEQKQNDTMRHILLSCAYYGSTVDGISNSLDVAVRLLRAAKSQIIFRTAESWQESVCPTSTLYNGDEVIGALYERIGKNGFAIDRKGESIDLYVGASDDQNPVIRFERNAEQWRDEEIAFAIAAAGVIGMALRRTRMESQLRAAVIAAQAGNKAKSDFLSQMSHEIRTPLNAVLGMSHIAREQDDIEQVRLSLDKIIGSGKHLHGIISDILDLSSIEAGKLELVPERMNVREAVTSACDMISFIAKDKGLEFFCTVADDFPEYILGDRNRIGQILINLLNNAVKFTREGSVSLDASLAENMMVFTVRDTGIGIKPEEKEKLFGAFERLDRKANRDISGNGLGLHITSSLVGMMSGELEVDSRYGEGSTFTVRLPLTKAQALEDESAVRLTGSNGVKALVVDDSPIGAMVTTGLLAKYGVECEVADCAERSIEMADLSEKYDIIFMDHMLPDYDGAEACRRLRASGITTPIAALTANVFSEHREMFAQAGADDFLSKPIDVNSLEQILIKLVDKEKLIFS